MYGSYFNCKFIELLFSNQDHRLIRFVSAIFIIFDSFYLFSPSQKNSVYPLKTHQYPLNMPFFASFFCVFENP